MIRLRSFVGVVLAVSALVSLPAAAQQSASKSASQTDTQVREEIVRQ